MRSTAPSRERVEDTRVKPSSTSSVDAKAVAKFSDGTVVVHMNHSMIPTVDLQPQVASSETVRVLGPTQVPLGFGPDGTLQIVKPPPISARYTLYVLQRCSSHMLVKASRGIPQ